MANELVKVTSKKSEDMSRAEGIGNQVFRLDDRSYRANSDILDGVQFSATLQIRTPLSVLEHHGEVFHGPPSQAPKYGTQADGIWTFRTKPFRDLGVAFDEAEFTHASDAGPIKPSVYLPFLIKFRSIVEGRTSHEGKIAALRVLSTQSVEFREIWRKLSSNYGDFPASFFYLQFTNLPGVGRRLAKRLYEAGFHNESDILHASASQLINVPGLGSATAAKIKAVYRSGGDGDA